MDIIITYVDGLDPLWQQDYEQNVGRSIMAKRFRDWGTLRYLMRGIENHLSFVRKVHLVVARESQVPQWVDRSKVNVVLHSDIIPREFLPVFNSSSIEMFLHRIPDLDEQILYFNDDMFPMRDCSLEDFFPDGRPVIGMKKQLLVGASDFRYLVRRSDRLARETAGLEKSMFYLRPQHICYALLKSRCEELFEARKSEIMASVTRLRERVNYNIYLYSDYIHYLGASENRKQSNKHYSLAVASLEEIVSFIRSPFTDFVCINDVQMSDAKFQTYHEGITTAFELAFPEKSSYEL